MEKPEAKRKQKLEKTSNIRESEPSRDNSSTIEVAGERSNRSALAIG